LAHFCQDGLTDVTRLAGDDVLAQLQIMADGLDIEFFRFSIDGLLEMTVIPAVERGAGHDDSGGG